MVLQVRHARLQLHLVDQAPLRATSTSDAPSRQTVVVLFCSDEATCLVPAHAELNVPPRVVLLVAVIKDDVLYIEAGGGIVADSVPRLEWKESMNKGRAIFQAVRLVESGFEDIE